MIAAPALSFGPLTPRHDSVPGAADINFFTGTADYLDSVLLPHTMTHSFDAGGGMTPLAEHVLTSIRKRREE